MKCPSCSQPPMSLVRWLIMLDPTHIMCIHCRTRLTPTRRWRRRYYLITTLAMLFIVSPSLLAYFALIPYESLLEIFFVVVILTFLLLLILSAYFWKRFEYDIEQGQS